MIFSHEISFHHMHTRLLQNTFVFDIEQYGIASNAEQI